MQKYFCVLVCGKIGESYTEILRFPVDPTLRRISGWNFFENTTGYSIDGTGFS